METNSCKVSSIHSCCACEMTLKSYGWGLFVGRGEINGLLDTSTAASMLFNRVY